MAAREPEPRLRHRMPPASHCNAAPSFAPPPGLGGGPQPAAAPARSAELPPLEALQLAIRQLLHRAQEGWQEHGHEAPSCQQGSRGADAPGFKQQPRSSRAREFAAADFLTTSTTATVEDACCVLETTMTDTCSTADSEDPESPPCPTRSAPWPRPRTRLQLEVALAAPSVRSAPAAAPAAPAATPGPALALQLSEALAEEPSRPGAPACPSVGSLGHHYGLCKPCDFVHRGFCRTGADCKFCHLCGVGASRQRKIQKRKFLRALGHTV